MKACVFDTETTGLISSRRLRDDQLPQVIEFYGAMVEFNKSGKHKLLHDLELLIKPSTQINEQKTGKHNITKITGLTNIMLADAPAFKEVATKIFGMLEAAPLVIAHNCAYDSEMLNIEADRLSYKIKWPRTLCTVEATAYLKGDRLTLAELHEHLFNTKPPAKHRAKVDVETLIRCCGELHRKGVI
jgi:DNA polymerase III alpha subunit (gram-positive type)